jgi:hypothetical protein
MQITIYAPFSGWRIVPAHETNRVHGLTVDVTPETASRWQRVLDEYHEVQAEIQAVYNVEIVRFRQEQEAHGDA